MAPNAKSYTLPIENRMAYANKSEFPLDKCIDITVFVSDAGGPNKAKKNKNKTKSYRIFEAVE